MADLREAWLIASMRGFAKSGTTFPHNQGVHGLFFQFAMNRQMKRSSSSDRSRRGSCSSSWLFARRLDIVPFLEKGAGNTRDLQG